MIPTYHRPPRMQTIAHLAVLQKFIYRLASDTLTPEHAARLRIIIPIYTRLYTHG